MSSRMLASLVVTGAMAVGAFVSPEAQAPTAAATTPEAVKAFIASRMARDWTPPKTPWGDPDIQGVFTTKDEANTPFERPAEWAGRPIEDVTPAELAAAVVSRQEAAVERAPFAGGGESEAGVAIAVPIHWFDNLAARQQPGPGFVHRPGRMGTIPPLGQREPRLRRHRSRSEERLRTAVGAMRILDRDVADRSTVCSTRSACGRTPAIYGNSYQILQTPDYVVMRYEMVHEARVIPLDGRPHASSTIRGYVGDSRGHWEGNSLVVVTTNFNLNLEYRDFPVFSRGLKAGAGPMKNLRMVERFTRIAPDRVEWTTTIDDPTVWTRPWTYSFPLSENNRQIIYEYACHEGNYAMANILSAQRAADRKAAAGR